MPVINHEGTASQLIDHASVFRLETMLKEKGIDASPLWLQPDDWSQFGKVLENWIESTAKYLAAAIVAACSVIDFEAAIIDGGFPQDVRARLVKATIRELEQLDLQGIAPPEVIEGAVGSGARALGGASLPLFSRYLLDQKVLFKEPPR